MSDEREPGTGPHAGPPIWSLDYVGTCSDCHRSVTAVGSELVVKDCHWCRLPVCSACRFKHNCEESHVVLEPGLTRAGRDPTDPPLDLRDTQEFKDAEAALRKPVIEAHVPPNVPPPPRPVHFTVVEPGTRVVETRKGETVHREIIHEEPPPPHHRWYDEEDEMTQDRLNRWTLTLAILAVSVSIVTLILVIVLAQSVHLNAEKSMDASLDARLDAIEERMKGHEASDLALRAQVAAHHELPMHPGMQQALSEINRRLDRLEAKTR